MQGSLIFLSAENSIYWSENLKWSCEKRVLCYIIIILLQLSAIVVCFSAVCLRQALGDTRQWIHKHSLSFHYFRLYFSQFKCGSDFIEDEATKTFSKHVLLIKTYTHKWTFYGCLRWSFVTGKIQFRFLFRRECGYNHPHGTHGPIVEFCFLDAPPHWIIEYLLNTKYHLEWPFSASEVNQCK